MKRRMTAIACIAALLVTAGQPVTVEGKSKNHGLLPAEQIAEAADPHTGGDFISGLPELPRRVLLTDRHYITS